MTAVLLLLIAAAAIYLCCESFTNAIEWLGHRLRLGQTATGTVLAALGTALPESVVTLVATAFGASPSQQSIGIGAAIGGPLALATAAYGAVGISLLRQRRAPNLAEPARIRLRRDQALFLAIFAVKLGLGLVLFAGKGWCGAAFLAAYAIYLVGEMRQPVAADTDHTLEPLKLRPNTAEPGLGWILLQCALAAGVTFLASRLFVAQLDILAPRLGIPPQLAALLIVPIATELPEILNAVIWVRHGKDGLALANISGSMMIQATVPTAFGLLFTPWLLDRSLILAGLATALAIVYLMQLFRNATVGPLRLALVALVLPALLVALFR